jgi:competence protein ComEA
MNQLLRKIQTLFSLERREAKATILLFLGILVAFLIQPIYEKMVSGSSAEITIHSTQSLDSLASSPRFHSYEKRSNYSSAYSSNDKRAVQLFSFNPNTASTDELQTLGIPKWMANRIENFRKKGGKFKYKEDLMKIYDFREEDYQRLENYITLPSKEERISSFSEIENPVVAEKIQPKEEVFVRKNNEIKAFDINTADTTQLKAVRGIGSGFASRIIKFRDSMGGFYDASQVRETFGLPPEVADELLKFASVKTPIRRIDINTVTLETFKHPSLKAYQRKAIIAYREQHGAFQSVEDLKKIKVLDEVSLSKIAPYLRFE